MKDKLLTPAILFSIAVLCLVTFRIAGVVMDLKWSEGTIIRYDNGNVIIKDDTGETRVLAFTHPYRLVVEGKHIIYRYFASSRRLLDFWYDGEEIVLEA